MKTKKNDLFWASLESDPKRAVSSYILNSKPLHFQQNFNTRHSKVNIIDKSLKEPDY